MSRQYIFPTCVGDAEGENKCSLTKNFCALQIRFPVYTRLPNLIKIFRGAYTDEHLRTLLIYLKVLIPPDVPKNAPTLQYHIFKNIKYDVFKFSTVIKHELK